MRERCRVCLGASPQRDIFTGEEPICLRLAAVGIEIQTIDSWPSNICDSCLTELDIAYQFRKKCEASELELRLKISENTFNNENTPWKEESYDNLSIKSEGETTHVLAEQREKDAVLPKIDSKDTNKHNKKKKKSDLLKKKTLKSKNKTLKKFSTRLERKKKSIYSKVPIKLEDYILNNEATETYESIDQETSQERGKTKKHMCTTCGKTFHFYGNLLNHERVHSGDKPFKCNTCDRSFAQSGHLLVHKRTHSGIKPYQCDICPRAFSVSHTLKKHLRTHTGERPYSCKICNKTFVTSYHLSNHHKRHMGDKMFKCDWADCQRGFVNMSEMKRHRARHEKSVAKSTSKNIQERLQSIPLIPLQGLSSRLLTGNISHRKVAAINSEIMQIASTEYLHFNNVQDMSMFSSLHAPIGSHSIYEKCKNQ